MVLMSPCSTHCLLEVLPHDFSVVSTPTAKASTALASALDVTGGFAAAFRTTKGFSLVIPGGTQESKERWSVLRVQGPSQPWILAGLCQSLADAGVEAVLHSALPCASHLSFRKGDLPAAARAVVKAGAALRLPGLRERHVPERARVEEERAGLFRLAGAGPDALRFQACCGLFVELQDEVPTGLLCDGTLTASRCGYSSHGSQHTVVSLHPPRALLDSGELDVGERGDLHEEQQVTEGGVLALELEDEEPQPGGAPRKGVWLFCGRRFARVIGPPLGSPSSQIASTLCGSLGGLLRSLDDKVDEELEWFEALEGKVSEPGILEVLRSSAGLQAGTVLFSAEEGFASRDEDLLLLTKVTGETQRWRVLEETLPFNPFSAEAWAKAIPSAKSPDMKTSTGEKEELALREGDKVKYWSGTVKRWLPATFKRWNPDGTLHLDLKPKAQLQHVKRAQETKAPSKAKDKESDEGSEERKETRRKGEDSKGQKNVKRQAKNSSSSSEESSPERSSSSSKPKKRRK